MIDFSTIPVFIINLKRRPDRLETSLDLCRKFNLQATIVEAVDGNNIANDSLNSRQKAELACKLSHLKALEIPCDSKYRLILEDDFDPVDNFLFRKSEFEQAPSDFDFLYLGANHTDKPVSYNEFFSKVTQASTTHAYIIREAAVSSVISDIKSSAKQIDLIYRDLQYYDKYRFYCCNTNLINQRNTFSDIIGDFVNYDFMR